MEAFFRSIFSFLFLLGMTFSNTFGALRGKMNAYLEDPSDVTWAHAVNSWDALEKALASSVDFLEADVLMGHIGNDGKIIPVMAHPPDESSDLSLDNFLNTVVKHRSDKGLKLDFKSLEVLEPSLRILEKYVSKLNSSIWLNADVLSGPINSTTNPVQVEKFLALCHQYFPNATLSVGWTTFWFPTAAQESWRYGWQHVRQMADYIKCIGYENNYPKFTFPVRGIFASRSIKQLKWLLSVIPGSSLTVWSAKFDPLEIQDLLRIRSSFPEHLVYYDIPEPISSGFQAKKNSVKFDNYVMKTDEKQWMTVTSGQSDNCSFLTYIKNDTISFGKSSTTVVLHKKIFSSEKESNLNVTGFVTFFNIDDDFSNSKDGFHELKLVAVDVSLLTKNMSDSTEKKFDLSTSDTDVILSAVNSSVIYNFQHKCSETETSCRIFQLDALADKSFEAWTIPCEDTGEEMSFEELLKSGISEISSRKRLVLPKGPFMFGFVSTGEEYVVIHDLKINGQKRALTSGSKSTTSIPLGLLSVIILCIFSLYILI